MYSLTRGSENPRGLAAYIGLVTARAADGHITTDREGGMRTGSGQGPTYESARAVFGGLLASPLFFGAVAWYVTGGGADPFGTSAPREAWFRTLEGEESPDRNRTR